MCDFRFIKINNATSPLKGYRKHFKNKYTLPYCDTDSFVYNVKHPDIYEWIK